MKLSEKGRAAPPPKLPRHAQRVAETLATWEGVRPRAHWLLGDETELDGADFYVGEAELGHLHLDGEAHVPVTKRLRSALVAAGLAEPFAWSAAWVTHAVESKEDEAAALFLFELSYARIRGATEAELLERLRGQGSGSSKWMHQS